MLKSHHVLQHKTGEQSTNSSPSLPNPSTKCIALYRAALASIKISDRARALTAHQTLPDRFPRERNAHAGRPIERAATEGLIVRHPTPLIGSFDSRDYARIEIIAAAAGYGADELLICDVRSLIKA